MEAPGWTVKQEKKMSSVLEQLGNAGIVPVIKLENPKDAVPLMGALADGGLPVAEITFRAAGADEAIRRATQGTPNVLVGAGTVLTVDQVKKAVDAGAMYIVTPGFNPKVVDYCVTNGIPVTPGVNNPTGVEQGLEFGLEVLKFFPAEVSGGVKMLKALGGPYGQMNFIPTGGISLINMIDYLSLKNVIAVGGSWVVPSELLAKREFSKIRELTAESVEAVRAIRNG